MISRKLFAILAMGAALSLFSCKNAEDINIEEPEQTEYSIVAVPATTKTVNDGIATRWTQGDELSVFVKSNSYFSSTYSAKFSYVGDNRFQGKFQRSVSGGNWYALYPYSQSNSNASRVSVSLNPSPVQTGNDSRAHLAGADFPLYGSVTSVSQGKTPEITMHQVASAADFVITNGEDKSLVVKTIEFSAPAKIVGGFTADITQNSVSWTASNTASNKVTLTVNNCPSIAKGGKGSFYVGVMPFSSNGEFSVKVTGTLGGETVVSEKTFTKSMTFQAGQIHDVRYTFTVSTSGGGDEPGGDVVEGVDLGTFNLVNDDIDPYLEEADSKYTDSNWSSVSVVRNYRNGSGSESYAQPPERNKSYDRPKPVTIPLNGYNGQNTTVTIYNDSARKDVEVTVSGTVSNNAFEVYSLIPNSTYYFSATVGGKEVSNGTFKTIGRRRYLKVSDLCSPDHANNLRDFGGLKTVNNGVQSTLRYNLIFRGTNMDATTAEEQAIITGYMGVRRDVDFRAKGGSSSSNAHQPLDKSIVAYTNYGFDSFEKITNDILKKTISEIISTVSKGEAAYLHCYAGADRTGYICMLLEAVCGVSQKDCSIDYELTSFSCVGTRDRMGRYNNHYFTKGMNKIEGMQGSTFQEKATKVLTEAGITKDQIEALKKAMVVGY